MVSFGINPCHALSISIICPSKMIGHSGTEIPWHIPPAVEFLAQIVCWLCWLPLIKILAFTKIMICCTIRYTCSYISTVSTGYSPLI
ncbi:hypothetical protein FKM82_000796 [Ascaphus truei]